MPLRILALLLAMTLFDGYSFGQSAQVTTDALYHTFMIATNIERGTAFSINVDNREYWITAKHLFNGVRTGPAGVFNKKEVRANILSQIGSGDESHDLHWITETFRVIDPGKDVDILVLVPDHPLLDYPRGFTLMPTTTGIGLGGNCEFLGFPYGGGSRVRMQYSTHSDKWSWIWIPYVKHCTISGRILEKGLDIWVLDGINNLGFSGGPVLYGTGSNQTVFAVISAFKQEPLEVVSESSRSGERTSSIPPAPKLPGEKSKESQKEIVEANSGFIMAFSIGPAIEAIKKHPIGPLLPATNSK